MRGHIRQRGADPKAWSLVVELGRDPATGKRRQKWHTFHGNKRQANEALAKLVTQVAEGTYVEPAKLTLQEYLELWLHDYARSNVSPKTLRSYTTNVRRHIAPGLGVVGLSRLKPMQIQALYSSLLDTGLSNRTVRYVHTTLRSALARAVQWGLTAVNPAAAVQPPREVKRELTVLTLDAAQLLLRALEGHRLYLPVLLAVVTGMRRGEILGLTWAQVDFDRRTLHVTQALAGSKAGVPDLGPTKTLRSRRAIALSDACSAALQETKARQGELKLVLGEDYHDYGLVVALENGHPWDSSNFAHQFRRIADRLGLQSVRFHDLRHTHATLLLAEGVHPKVVSERLGHSSITLTMDTYSHVMPILQRDAADVLDRALALPPSSRLQSVSKPTKKDLPESC